MASRNATQHPRKRAQPKERKERNRDIARDITSGNGRITEAEKLRRAGIIDELGQLDLVLTTAKLKYKTDNEKSAKRAEVLREEVHTWAEQTAADQSLLVEGTLFDAHISVKDKKRVVSDIFGLFIKLGKEKFIDACSVTLAALEKLLSKDELKPFITEVRAGNRTVITLPKAATAAQ